MQSVKGEVLLCNRRSSVLLATKAREGEMKGVERRQRRRRSARVQEAKDEAVGD